jgi:carbon monoxide dehydrogenase subunit G
VKFTGDAILNAPVDRVWQALLDPAVLVRTIPGCERLEATGEHAYAMTVTAGVAAIKGTYSGSCSLFDLDPHSSLVMRLQGAGAPGTIGADVRVAFKDGGDGTTAITYDADAVVGGMVGGVGQRMLTSVSRRMAGEFFGNVDAVLAGTGPTAAPVAPAEAAAAVGAPVETQPGVFVAPPRAAGGPSHDDFLRGVAVGAGLVLAGVVVGGLFGRRR